jgi:LacI family gluconate utilization system Gnt-I transcriptional repressor
MNWLLSRDPETLLSRIALSWSMVMTDKPQDDRGGKKPSQRLGVREIAKRVGVAPMTVSRVLSNPDMVSPETRAKVLHAIEQAGFVPNRLASSMRGNGRRMPRERLFDAAGAG